MPDNRTLYPYIVAWGRLMGSLETYIIDQCDHAAHHNVDRAAIYKSANGMWVTWNPRAMPVDTVLRMARHLERMGVSLFPDNL